MHSCISRLGSLHMVSNVGFLVPPEQSPKMRSLRGGIPDASGGCIVSPDGRVSGDGVGNEVRRDKRDKGCDIGGLRAFNASALD